MNDEGINLVSIEILVRKTKCSTLVNLRYYVKLNSYRILSIEFIFL